jgi:ribosome-binding factor A
MEHYSERQLKVSSELKNIAADFFERESNGASLITVTRCEISPDLRYCTIFISVLPESKEEAAIHFAKRMRPELRTYVKKRFKAKVLPFFELALDYGEKNRQHIDDLMRKEKPFTEADQVSDAENTEEK